MENLKDTVEFDILISPEQASPEDYACECGASNCYEAHIKPILERLEAGEVTAWCRIEVRATVSDTDISASDYLGFCSFESKEAFQASSKYAQMKETTFKALGALVAYYRARLSLIA